VGYFVERAARDPVWRAEQISGALALERARREADPESFRAARRAATRRTRERHRAVGLTFHELLERSRASPLGRSTKKTPSSVQQTPLRTL
jgi:hypothetical protein